MEQAVTKIRETSARTIASYPTLDMAERAMQNLSANHVPIQFASIVAEGVRSKRRTLLKKTGKVFALVILGALAATVALIVDHYWVTGTTATIEVDTLMWTAVTGAIVGLLGSFLLRSPTEPNLQADVFEIMVSDQYASQAKEILTPVKETRHELRTETEERPEIHRASS